jgi:hypothetical protein
LEVFPCVTEISVGYSDIIYRRDVLSPLVWLGRFLTFDIQNSGNIITWRIDSLAATDLETATLAYTATHNPARGGGVKRTNSSITYSDAQGQQIIFPDPTVLVRVPIPSSAIARGKLKEVVPSGRFKDELLNEMDLKINCWLCRISKGHWRFYSL